MANRIEVSKGNAAGLGADGVLTYNPSSLEDSLKSALAQAKSSGWKTVALDAPPSNEELRTAFAVVAEFLFGSDLPQNVIFACPNDSLLEAGKALVEEAFS